MPDIFKDFLPAIMQTKKDCMEGDIYEKDYIPFLTNKALSVHADCIFLANTMNLNSHLDKKLQFQYLINTVRGYKRPFVPWPKKNSIENIELVKEYYNYSDQKALEALKILTEDQIKKMKKLVDKGGIDDKPKRSSMDQIKKSR